MAGGAGMGEREKKAREGMNSIGCKRPASWLAITAPTLVSSVHQILRSTQIVAHFDRAILSAPSPLVTPLYLRYCVALSISLSLSLSCSSMFLPLFFVMIVIIQVLHLHRPW